MRIRCDRNHITVCFALSIGDHPRLRRIGDTNVLLQAHNRATDPELMAVMMMMMVMLMTAVRSYLGRAHNQPPVPYALRTDESVGQCLDIS